MIEERLLEARQTLGFRKCLDAPPNVRSSTGGYQQWGEIGSETYIYLLTIMMTQDDVEDFFEHRPDFAIGKRGSRVRNFKDIRVDIYINVHQRTKQLILESIAV